MSLQLAMLADVFETARDRFDIVHSHIDYWSFPFASLTRVPTVSTMHGRLDIPDLHPVYHRFPEAALVSISDSQRAPLAHMNWVATVYHGMPQQPASIQRTGRRLSRLHRTDIAGEGYRRRDRGRARSGVPLKIAAKVDAVDREYFAEVIEPRIKPPMIEYIGEIDDAQKSDFLGGALALLFTIDWPEPFGLAMIEALACGTPVIARPCGSVREVIKPGVTGFIARENRRIGRRGEQDRFDPARAMPA